MKRRIYTLGTVSHGTMRPEDLIPAFADELRHLARANGSRDGSLALCRAVERREALGSYYGTEDADWDLEELFERLDAFAPPYFYFGSHPGDGADYGFWLSESFLQDYDGLKVRDPSWALRLKGIPVAYFACDSGMSQCVLGTNRDNPYQAMPCKSCTYQSRTLYTGVETLRRSNVQKPAPSSIKGSSVSWFDYQRDAKLANAIEKLSVPELMTFEWQEIPLGKLCLPGLRWILRIHHLDNDENTRYLLREYILSAWNVAEKFADFLGQTQPRAVLVFNGQCFPEATARYIAQRRGLKVITHEVGLQPATACFTEGEATAYPIHIPDEFELNDEQNAKLDAYLTKRFQGDFTAPPGRPSGRPGWPRSPGRRAR